MDEHGTPVEFKRMISVITQQSEVTNEQETAGKKQEPENKIIEDETMELGRVRFFAVNLARFLFACNDKVFPIVINRLEQCYACCTSNIDFNNVVTVFLSLHKF